MTAENDVVRRARAVRERTDPKRIAADIARELREHPERWYRGNMAADVRGFGLDNANNPHAVCWCLEGHINRRLPGKSKLDVYEAFRQSLGHRELFLWNDAPERTVSDVIALCEKVATS